MKTNLPNLPDNYRVEFLNGQIHCSYSLAFPKKIALKLTVTQLELYNLIRTSKGYRCLVKTTSPNIDSIFIVYIRLKNKVMLQCRNAKVAALKTEIKQLSLF